MSDIVPQASPFDQIRRLKPDGTEFWSARDLMPLLGYEKWQRFEDALDRAKFACQNSGQNTGQHFLPEAVKNQGRGRPSEDFHLTRYAAYLVAMNSDPRKAQVAAAQTYFAVKTREAEVRQENPEALPTGKRFLQMLAGNMLEALEETKVEIRQDVQQQLSDHKASIPIRMFPGLKAHIFALGQEFAKHHPKKHVGAWRAFKEAFGYAYGPLACYDDLPQGRYSEAVHWLQVQIETFSNQSRLIKGA